MKNYRYKKWNLLFVTFVLFLCGSVFAFNYLINPYGERERFVQNKYKPVLNERAKKYNYIFYEKNYTNYDSLILGSSRVMQIIPSHITNGERFYNFGVHIASNSEKLFILKEWLKYSDLQSVIFAIDLNNFHNKEKFTQTDIEKFKKPYKKNYLSISTLKLSIKSLQNQISNNPQVFFEKDGELNYFSKNIKINNQTYDFSDTKYQNLALSTYNKIQFDEVDTSNFKLFHTLKKIAEENNIKLYIIITPLHYEYWRLIETNEAIFSQYQLIKIKLQSIFGKIYNFSCDKAFNSNNEFFYDIVHYRSSLGDEIIQSLFFDGSYGDNCKIEDTDVIQQL